MRLHHYVIIFFIIVFHPFLFISSAWPTVTDEEILSIQNASKAFTKIAKQTIPTVVFIKVEQTIDTAVPFRYNNPFDLFDDEMFRRFFGHRFPQMKPSEKQKRTGWGSGFIISKQGHILTNHHVVGDADNIAVRLSDGREFEAQLIGTDPKSDVALIKINGAENLPFLSLGDSDALEIGEWVMAIGNPFGLSHTLTVGVVSAKGRTSVGITDYEDFIQTDAAINPGNSGGPLINIHGEAIGINSAIFSRSGGYMGLGFAIPINMVKKIKDQLIAYGKVDRGYLGVEVQDLSKELVEYFNLNRGSNGVLIAQIHEGSPAEMIGLLRGDILVELDGKPVQNIGHFRNMIAFTTPGTLIDIKVIRAGKIQTFNVELGSISDTETTGIDQNEIMDKIGFSVQNLTPELADQLNYQGLEGVLITDIQAGSPAAFAGLRPGLIIPEVNRQVIRNVSEFAKALSHSRKTKKLLLLVRDSQIARYLSFSID